MIKYCMYTVHDVCIYTYNIHTYMHPVEAMKHNNKTDIVMKCMCEDIGCCQWFSVMRSFPYCPSPSPREVIPILNYFLDLSLYFESHHI